MAKTKKSKTVSKKTVSKKATKKIPTANVKKISAVPVGVKIISVFCYLGATLIFLIGLFLLTNPSVDLGVTLGEATSSGFLVFISFLLIGFAILTFFIAKGLWFGKSWARITAIVISILFILNDFSSISSTGIDFNIVLGLAIEIIILAYLTLDKEVKKAFA